MELGLMTVSLLDRSWEDALDAIAEQGVRYVEANAGGHIPKSHYDPARLIEDRGSLAQFRKSIEARALQIAAFGCYGNPVHPAKARALAAHEDFVATCRLASELGVPRVAVISGCPGGGPHDRAPNWIINSIYPDFRKAYEWQWKQCLIPYWQEAARVADAHGVRICIEPHGGDMVYNAQTFFRLRDAVGPTIGANFDPSHLFWMGVDIEEVIDDLGDAIYYVHAKDVAFQAAVVRKQGLVPAVDFADWNGRSWLYRAVGHGHPVSFWRDFVTALRRAGYDDVVTIELEEPFMTTDDALAASVATMRAVVPADPAPTGNWFDTYDWVAAEVE